VRAAPSLSRDQDEVLKWDSICNHPAARKGAPGKLGNAHCIPRRPDCILVPIPEVSAR